MNATNVIRGKIWGTTNTIFSNNNVEVARITVKKGGYCSTHLHFYKYNMFYVESGKLEVVIYREDSNKTIEDKTILYAGDITYVEPNIKHKFYAFEDTVAYEVYWTQISPNDILRDNAGGVVN